MARPSSVRSGAANTARSISLRASLPPRPCWSAHTSTPAAAPPQPWARMLQHVAHPRPGCVVRQRVSRRGERAGQPSGLGQGQSRCADTVVGLRNSVELQCLLCRGQWPDKLRTCSDAQQLRRKHCAGDSMHGGSQGVVSDRDGLRHSHGCPPATAAQPVLLHHHHLRTGPVPGGLPRRPPICISISERVLFRDCAKLCAWS